MERERSADGMRAERRRERRRGARHLFVTVYQSMGSATYKTWGRHKWQLINIEYILYTWAAPELWFEGGTSKKFHTWIPLKSCTAMASPKFRFGGGHSAQMYSSKTFVELLKIYKQFDKNLKNSPKIFKNKI